jgi:3-polyprenyl-4-hydroxybenzoate decarboxylase
MAFASLRDFLRRLEAEKLWSRRRPVSPKLE